MKSLGFCGPSNDEKCRRFAKKKKKNGFSNGNRYSLNLRPTAKSGTVTGAVVGWGAVYGTGTGGGVPINRHTTDTGAQP